jgi:antitoxin component YwqK of YwqJK toxin-antitoxin module
MYGMPSLPTPRVYSGWSDQKKMTYQNPRSFRGYSGPYISNSNGHKVLEGTYKDGKWEGLWTGWHSENGQKMFEGTYIDGTKIIARYWNIEGIEVENLDEARGWGVYRKSD